MKKRRPPTSLTQTEWTLAFSFGRDASSFTLHLRLGIFAWLQVDEQGVPLLKEAELLSSQEIALLRPLLEHVPHYCPHEVLYASFYTGSTEENKVNRARERLQEAKEYGTWDHEMRPMRNVLSRVRQKVEPWGFVILTLLDTGYKLEYHPPDATV